MTFAEYKIAVEQLGYGKRLPAARYVFTDESWLLPEPLAGLILAASSKFSKEAPFNVVKFHTETLRVSLLHYPLFFDDPHPALHAAVIVDLARGQAKHLVYSSRDNPPILHRKETMLPPSHPLRQEFETLSKAEEDAGLYQDTSRIGFRANWDRLLADKGLSYQGHHLINQSSPEPAIPEHTPSLTVFRHRTAMTRKELSKPVREVLQLGLLVPTETTFFDFGCGHGSDMRLLQELGVKASGWDPVHQPNKAKMEADVVNLGFVLNVIEDPAERIDTLQEAWSLTREVLIVSTLVEGQEGYYICQTRLNDGIVTTRGTFQKYFAQTELQLLIEETLEVEADAIGLGIFLVFRRATDRQAFLFSRVQRTVDDTSIHQRLWRTAAANRRHPAFEELYAIHQPLMDAFWLRMVTLGRQPVAAEFDAWDEITEKIRTPSKLARLLLRHFGEDLIEETRLARTDDLLIYLALGQFRQRVAFGQFPKDLQRDIKAFFGSYQAAVDRAKALLWSAGEPGVVATACDGLTVGYATEDHHTVHRSLLDSLPPVLRVYVHCSSIIYGNPHDADLIKIHKHSGKVTLQFYDDFDGKSLPELQLRVKVSLRTLQAQIFDHSSPPFRQLMPFKERFLDPDNPKIPEILKFSKKLRKLGLTPEATSNGISPEMMATVLRRFSK